MEQGYEGLFADSDSSYTGPKLNDDMVASAESTLGVKLPSSYVGILRVRNGGSLRRNTFATSFPTSWAEDHFEVRALLGIDGESGIDSIESGSQYLIGEWEYPNIGVVIVECPSGGHDTVMLDYSKLNKAGEPTVAYIDEDRSARTVAESFEEFIGKLEPNSE